MNCQRTLSKLKGLAFLAIFLPPASAFADKPDSNKVAANSDVAVFANALTEVVTFTNFFTTIENLDDLSAPTETYPFDFINDQGGALVISPFTGDFRSSRLDYLNRPIGLGWSGPHVSAFSNLISFGRFTDGSHFYDEGHPLDPWFNPYLLYTPLGLVVPSSESITLGFHGDRFDTFTVVSLGPDGIVGNDDVIRSVAGFSGVSNVAVSSSRLRNFTAKSNSTDKATFAAELHVKGYNFGAAQGTGGITVAGNSVPILSWSNTLVIAGINTLPGSVDTIVLTRNGGQTSSLEGVIDERSVASIADWVFYE